MKTVRLTTLGRHGNQMFRAAFAMALCEQNGYELHMEESPLNRIFTLDGYVPIRPTGTEDIVIDGYHQYHASLIYSRTDCRRWFKLRPEIMAKLENWDETNPVAHVRRGDYLDAGYPVITETAAISAAVKAGYPVVGLVSDDYPDVHAQFTGDLFMLPDFYRMMTAPVLFRGNSSFSWWAATLGHGKVFSPIITGLAGGVEHDEVPYVLGNHPRLCELDFVTDLHLRET